MSDKKLSRGQKLCKSCNTVNGVRSYECKNCGNRFKMRMARKTKKRRKIADFQSLNKGDVIKVSGRHGDYYLDGNGMKQRLTDKGTYTVLKTDDNGICAFGSNGFTYIYMGKCRQSDLLPNIYKEKHKILLISTSCKNDI